MTTTMMPTNQRVKLAEIKTHSRNYNRHPAKQIVKTVSERFGFTATVISNYRGRNGNVVFQTWQIAPAHNMK